MSDSNILVQPVINPSPLNAVRELLGTDVVLTPDLSLGNEPETNCNDAPEAYEPWSNEYALQEPAPYQYEYTRLRNILENNGKIIHRSSRDAINLGYLREVLANRRLLDVPRDWITSALHEVRRQKPGYRNDFLPNLGMLLFSNPTFLERVCRCGQNHNRCKMRFWCPRCAYAEATNLWKTYLPNYHKGNFWFLTVGIDGDIPFNDANAFNLREFWTLLPDVINQVGLHSNYGIKGFYSSDEVSVRQFLPLRINPHVHAILDADDLDPQVIDDLESVFDQVLEIIAPGCGLTSSVNLRHIVSKEALKSALRYLIKPISLQNQYRTAWTVKVEAGSHPSWQLNNEVRDFITGVSYVSHYPKFMRHLKAYGSMAGSSDNFIGVLASRRNDYWDEVKAISLTDDQWGNYDHQYTE